mgnify:CR=1 FL=1
MQKPHKLIDFEKPLEPKYIGEWLDEEKIKILNIAGPRESINKGIYKKTIRFLEGLFQTAQKSVD